MSGSKVSSTLVDPSPSGVQSVQEIFLEVTAGPDAGRRWGPMRPPFRVGSALGNDVVLSDPKVSRFHCVIDRLGEDLVLADEGSTNGTWVEDCRIRQVYLPEDTPIRLGDTLLHARVSPTPSLAAISARRRFGDLLGESESIRMLFATLEKIAQFDAPVLIEGETGTGKELVAHALHSEGARGARPFIVVDCGALSASLVESELFGHAKGAFTGADSERKGAFELADGGTVFLDEVGELPLGLQPKLLRVLERGTFKRLGEGQERSVSVRILAATHRDLRKMVNEGGFREDLYFRLAVCPVHVPPLRERLEDIGPLADHFLEQALSGGLLEEDEPVPRLSRDSLSLLFGQAWSGNVRELKNLIERAVIMGEPEEVRAGDLSAALQRLTSTARKQAPARGTLEETKRAAEREYLIRLLAEHPRDLEAAATVAGIHVKSLSRLLRKYSLRRRDLAKFDSDSED